MELEASWPGFYAPGLPRPTETVLATNAARGAKIRDVGVYLKSALAGLVVAVVGSVVWEAGIFGWLWFKARQQMVAVGDSGGLGGVSVADPLPVVFVALFALGFWIAVRRRHKVPS